MSSPRIPPNRCLISARTNTQSNPNPRQAGETAGTVAALTTPPVLRLPPDNAQGTAPVFEGTEHSDEFKLRVDVQLVMVDAVVRDRNGRPMDNLQREDFRVFEDGTEQPITSFSQDKLPLAVALVVDRSGSIGFVMRQLRRTAYQTLSQLKPDDQVALFAFADQALRLEDLTTDRQRIAQPDFHHRSSRGYEYQRCSL